MKCKNCDNDARASGLCSKCYGAAWYAKNKAKVQKRKEKWYEDNRDWKIEYTKKWKLENPDLVKKIDANRDKVKNAKYYKDKYQDDPNYRLKVILRSRVRTALKDNFKSGKTLDMLGCSIEEFKKHIESKWQDGMTWDNHALDGWHIDHIIPLASFDLTDPEQLKKACHHTNMQPLWWEENIKKRDRL